VLAAKKMLATAIKLFDNDAYRGVCLKLKTKKAIPGMERPLTIACHMKIFILGLHHYPASWDLPSSLLPK
jgi:hypothetical protein